MKIGFIGLGNMGLGMAANLLTAGHQLIVYNRTQSKAQSLVARGARLAAQIPQACHGDVVITMLADDAALEKVVFGDSGILNHLADGCIHISCSTISVALSEKLALEHTHHSQRYVSAPVFGRPQAAAEAKLFIVAAGAPESINACMPLFDAMGEKTFPFGEKPWLANLVKLSGNFLISSVIESLSEALTLAAKAGIDQRAFLDFLTSTLFNVPVYKTYGGLILDKKFEPAGFAARLGLKDVRLALAAGESLNVPLPIADLVRNRLIELLARGGESLDWSALSQIAAEHAGLAA